MMDLWSLPTSLQVGGVVWYIETDYRNIIRILQIFNDPDFEEDERAIMAMHFFYKDFETMPQDLYQEALSEMVKFIDMGIEDNKPGPRVMDWEQDAAIIIPAVNKVAGTEIRLIHDLHWWTFMGYYMEIGEGTFASIVSIREKKAKGKKLEKWETEYYRTNKSRIDLKKRYSEEEQAQIDKLNDLLNGK